MAEMDRRPPYPDSSLVAGLEWTAPAHKFPGTRTDMHWHAWADDGALYCVDDDGDNFGGPWNFAHLLRVTGSPPDHHVEEIGLFPDLKRYSVDRLRYVDGALAVGSRLYVAAYDYVFCDPRRGGEPAWELGDDGKPRPTSDESWFVDAMSEHGGVASLMFSDDYGRTWENVPEEDTPYFLGPNFAGLAFVGFGPGYSGVPERFGDYVYAISNDCNWEGGDNVFLARVPRDRVLERSAWEFWVGAGEGRSEAEPVWAADEDAATPIYSDPGYVGHPTMTWNPELGRFLMALGSDSTPHNWDVDPEVARSTWHRRRELKILEAPTPWGPWGLVHFDDNWEGEHVGYLPQIPPNWLAGDGLSGTLLFSGDYKFGFLPRSAESFYGFMTRPFRLVLR
jgi:Domain of unknown function (DUF4185)